MHLLGVIQFARLLELVHQSLFRAIEILEIEPSHPHIKFFLLFAEVDGFESPLTHCQNLYQN